MSAPALQMGAVPGLAFAVQGAQTMRHAAAPTLSFALRVDRSHGEAFALDADLHGERWRIQLQRDALAVEQAQLVTGLRIQRQGTVERGFERPAGERFPVQGRRRHRRILPGCL